MTRKTMFKTVDASYMALDRAMYSTARRILKELLNELSAPAPQSAREVANKIKDEAFNAECFDSISKQYHCEFYADEAASLIEAYSESRVQEAVEKVKQEAWKWFCGTGREDNFPARYDRLSDSIDIAMKDAKL